MSKATPAQARQLGLLEEEFHRITEFLGREPNFTELCIYSGMWSEHCSYKNSILWLKKLPKAGKHVLAAAGEENAGLLDIGDGLAVAFKIESHNHPSAIEPFQGAATGVGGIHRDIFTMGARPVAALNSLRLGDLSLPKTRHLLQGIMAGIGQYGNCFGVPTVGGELYFDPCYNTNPLVNAMSVGVVEIGETMSAKAEGVGNPVFIVGSATGKDGIGGAAFASEDITEASAEKLPAVQVGDPFAEKLLLEATLEAIATGAVVGMQDMGAAGISCCTSEMSEKGGVGMKIDLSKAPTRQDNMLPFELLLSESQERMLIVAKAGREAEIEAVFEKWDLPCVRIGEVTQGPELQFFFNGEEVANVPAASLVLGGGAPVYERSYETPAYFEQIDKFDPSNDLKSIDWVLELDAFLELPSLADKQSLTEIYDSMVGAATMTTNLASDAAIVHLHNTNRALAMTTDCNSYWVMLNPERGTQLAVAEACRNLVCSGARPLGVTNCLNFGNPYNPEVYYQFAHAILGMKAACEAFELPVTGGNVSFYNQSSDDGPVFPTPVIGMVGLIEDARHHPLGLGFQAVQDKIYLLGTPADGLEGSTWLREVHNVPYSPAPACNLKEEAALQAAVLALNAKGLLKSAHDVSEGGLMLALLEAGFVGGFGFSVVVPEAYDLEGFLFSEAGGRVLISISSDKTKELQAAIEQLERPVELLELGNITPGEIAVNGKHLKEIGVYQSIYETAIPRRMQQSVQQNPF